jgi:electron transfer flavoprotein alpha subunit
MAWQNASDLRSWSGILVYIEVLREEPHPVTAELLEAAYGLSQRLGEDIYGVVICKDGQKIAGTLQGYPLKDLYIYETEMPFQPGLYEGAVKNCIDTLRPSIVLIGGTYEGRALAPRLAAGYRTGLTADCTGLDLDGDGNLVQIRPAFGGNLMARIVTPHSRPQFATIRRGIMKPFRAAVTTGTKVHITKFLPERQSISFLKREPFSGETGITGQRVLVVAGRGVKRKEDLAILRELAARLGGKLASSRALVEKGWMTADEQIGLSGHTVCPSCMITCGVSGTVQFMAGMRGTPNIIAINSDPDAPIFSIAHYPVCGDLYTIIPKLYFINNIFLDGGKKA